MATNPRPQTDPWWKPVWDLVVEVWIGSVLFAVIFAPAVVLDCPFSHPLMLSIRDVFAIIL